MQVGDDSLTASWTAATQLLYALVRRQKELQEILFQTGRRLALAVFAQADSGACKKLTVFFTDDQLASQHNTTLKPHANSAHSTTNNLFAGISKFV